LDILFDDYCAAFSVVGHKIENNSALGDNFIFLRELRLAVKNQPKLGRIIAKSAK
jgi:hypothetical protein